MVELDLTIGFLVGIFFCLLIHFLAHRSQSKKSAQDLLNNNVEEEEANGRGQSGFGLQLTASCSSSCNEQNINLIRITLENEDLKNQLEVTKVELTQGQNRLESLTARIAWLEAELRRTKDELKNEKRESAQLETSLREQQTLIKAAIASFGSLRQRRIGADNFCQMHQIGKKQSSQVSKANVDTKPLISSQ